MLGVKTMELKSSDANAIDFILIINSILIAIIISLQYSTDIYYGVGGVVVVFLFLLFFYLFGRSCNTYPHLSRLYGATMEDSLHVLKVSLVISVIISVVGVINRNPMMIPVTMSFLISPILYDFIRDAVFTQTTKKTPWNERNRITNFVEILVETTMSVIIGLIFVYILTGRF